MATSAKSSHATKALIEIFKSWGGFFGIFLLFFLLIFVGFAIKSNILIIYSLFVLLGIATRYPAARSPYDLSLIKPFTIILAIFDFKVAAFYAFTTWWIARRWNPMEDYSYTLTETISIPLTALLSPFLFNHSHNNIVTYTIFFLTLHFVFTGLIVSPLSRPATISTDFVFNFTEFLFTLLFHGLIVILIANQILNFIGVTGWQLGNISQIIGIFKGNFNI